MMTFEEWWTALHGEQNIKNLPPFVQASMRDLARMAYGAGARNALSGWTMRDATAKRTDQENL